MCTVRAVVSVVVPRQVYDQINGLVKIGLNSKKRQLTQYQL